jgi:hypothetical protein
VILAQEIVDFYNSDTGVCRPLREIYKDGKELAEGMKWLYVEEGTDNCFNGGEITLPSIFLLVAMFITMYAFIQ